MRGLMLLIHGPGLSPKGMSRLLSALDLSYGSTGGNVRGDRQARRSRRERKQSFLPFSRSVSASTPNERVTSAEWRRQKFYQAAPFCRSDTVMAIAENVARLYR